MATVFIQKRKCRSRNSYAIIYKDPITRKSIYYKTFRRYRDATYVANDLRMMIDHGKLYEIPRKKYQLNFLTFKDVANLTKESWQAKLKKGELRIITYDGYIDRMNKLIRKFGKRMIWEIEKDEIEEYIEKIIKENSVVTANRTLFILKQIYKIGTKEKAVIENPVESMRYFSEKHHARSRFLLPKQLDELIEACKELRGSHYMPALIYLGAEHGTSRQEALGLKWTDIDFDYNKKGIIRLLRTKNSVQRTVPLMPRSKEALLVWRDHQDWMRHRKRIDSNGCQLVFCRLDGKPIKRFYKAWRNICDVAGLKDFRYHDLRHTFCSNLLLSGASIKDVKEMIGHRHLETTDRYSHLTGFHKSKLYDQLAEHYNVY